MKSLTTTGIILRRIDYGEADRIITFLTIDYGRIRVIAKGVRKQKSKLAGGIELFSISELHFIKGRGDIDTIVSTRLINHYGEIVKDLSRTEMAYSFIKTIDKTIEDSSGSDYFVVLNESLAALNNSSVPLVVTELSFTMRVIQLQGQLPQFSVDNQGNTLDESAQYEFNFEAVSFVAKQEGPFNKNHLKLLRLFAHNPPQTMSAVQDIERYSNEVLPLARNLRGQYLQ
ncbi:MAG: DNA repair protein RecO [bacterium]|nr:DNA repair protein RecO [bacterium]